MPTIGSSTTGYAGVMTIDSGAILSILTGSGLNLTGNLVNNGAVTGSGFLTMNGTNLQKVMGKGVLNNVSINNTAGVYIGTSSDTLTINGRLKLTSGNLNTNGALILNMSGDTIAGPDVDGMIDPIEAGSITGKVIIQQYIKGGRRAYRFWCTPFQDSVALSQIENYLDITGPYGSLHGFTNTPSNTASAFWYDTKHSNSYSTSASGDPGWMPFTWCVDSTSGSTHVSADSNLVHRFEGIRLFVRGSKGQGLDGSAYSVNPVTIRQWGTVNTGSVAIPLKMGSLIASGGPAQTYNQKGNPYPAPVDIGTVVYNAWIDSQLYQPYLYVWNPYGGAAGVFITVSESTLTPYSIPANTSYQVRAKVDNAHLLFAESNKVGGHAVPLLKSNANGNVTLTVYDKDYQMWDELNINYNSDALSIEEWNDAGKAVNPGLNFYSWSADHHPLSVDFRPYDENEKIQLGFTTNYKQQFIIKADKLDMKSSGNLYLHDKFLGTYTLLNQGAEYSFEVTKNEMSQGDGRFELGYQSGEVAQGQASNTDLQMLIMPNPASESVNVNFITPGTDPVQIRILTIEGVCLLTSETAVLKSGSASLNLANLASGVYLVELSCGDKRIVKRLIKE